MRAREGVVDLLNQSLTIELTAINQYFLASEMCANWGFGRLQEQFRSLSLSEIKDAQALIAHIAHILYLDGLPNLQRLNQVRVGQDISETLRAGLDSECDAVDFCAAQLSTARGLATTPLVACSSQQSATRRSTLIGSKPSSKLFVRWG